MYKKSIARIEKENESSQAELSSPALQDIIATNHVVLAKKSREDRLSRACKAVIIMIILGLISIGIIILTVVLAHSRNSFMAIVSRSSDTNLSQILNNTRLLFILQENLTTIANDQRENENGQETTVSLTSYNLPMLTNANVHISPSQIMRTEHSNEYTSLSTSSIKSYPSTNKIIHEQTTTTTTDTTIITSTEEQEDLITTIKSQEHLFTTFNNPETSIIDSTSTINTITSPVPEETSFTSFISRHFNLQSSPMTTKERIRTTGMMDKLKAKIDDDFMNDLLFS